MDIMGLLLFKKRTGFTEKGKKGEGIKTYKSAVTKQSERCKNTAQGI